MHQSSRRHRHLTPGAQELILKWLVERENSPTTYTNHHASSPAEVARTKSRQCHSNGLSIKESVSTPQRGARREGSYFAHRSPSLNHIRLSPYPERNPTEKRAIAEKGSKGGYERKPRNKTKEDRYEYKGSTSRIQRKQSPTKAKKLSKKVRRHTINDNFHASNVPRDRLTLHSHPDLGIFRRGKTSSPVRAGELRQFPQFSGIGKLVNRGRVSEKGFSETRFLSKKLRSDSEKYTSHQIPNKRRKTRANPEDSQLLISNYFPFGLLEDEARTQGFEMEGNCTLLNSSPNLQTQSPADCRVRDTAAKRHGAVAVQSPADQAKHSGTYHFDVQGRGTSLSSPISISCNEHAPFLSESWSKVYMRQILHFDLSSRDKDNDESTHSGRKYWSLEDLKLLLQERERFWQGTKGQVVSESSPPGSRRNSREASSIYDVEDAVEDHLKQRKQMVLLEEMGNSFLEDNASLDKRFIFPGPLDKGLNHELELQHIFNSPLARHQQTTLGMSNAGRKEDFYPCSDTWKCPEYPTNAQDERFSSSVFQAGPLEQEANLQLASDAERNTAADVEVVMSFAEEAQLQDDIYYHYATQALDEAAHDAIMLPEEDTLEYVWDYAMRIPLGADNFESNPISQGVPPNLVSADKASLHFPWEAVADTSHGILSSHGIDPGLFGIPRDFWRRNR